jgi:hypothetical protein
MFGCRRYRLLTLTQIERCKVSRRAVEIVTAAPLCFPVPEIRARAMT